MTPVGLRRAFVAVELPSPVRAALEIARERAPRERAHRAGGLRWTPSEQWHLTLRFYGRVADADGLVDAVAQAVADVAPFTMALGGVGTFPAVERGTVVWAGVRDGTQPLAALAARVVAATLPLGDHDEGREYHPHVTLARARRARDLHDVVEAVGQGPFGTAWLVDGVSVFESDTRPEGAVHRVVARIAITGRVPRASAGTNARSATVSRIATDVVVTPRS